MKNILAIVLVSLIIFSVNAQEDYVINEGLAKMSRGEQNSFTITIPRASESVSADVWKKFTRGFKAKSKLDKKSREWFSDDANIEKISENSVDIYGRFSESTVDNSTDLTVWVDLGGLFLSSETNPDKAKYTEEVLRQYANEVMVEVVQEELKIEEGKLKDLDKDLSKLIKDNEGFHEEISKAEALIIEMRKNIEINMNEQAAKQSTIDGQRNTIDEVKAKIEAYKNRT